MAHREWRWRLGKLEYWRTVGLFEDVTYTWRIRVLRLELSVDWTVYPKTSPTIMVNVE